MSFLDFVTSSLGWSSPAFPSQLLLHCTHTLPPALCIPAPRSSFHQPPPPDNREPPWLSGGGAGRPGIRPRRGGLSSPEVACSKQNPTAGFRSRQGPSFQQVTSPEENVGLAGELFDFFPCLERIAITCTGNQQNEPTFQYTEKVKLIARIFWLVSFRASAHLIPFFPQT